MSSDPPEGHEIEVIDLDVGVERARGEIARSLSMVANFELRDGTTVSGVLGAINAEVLILERWDDTLRVPAEDPFVVRIESVRRIVIP